MIEYNLNTKINNTNRVYLFTTSNCKPCLSMKIILEKFEVLHSDKIAFVYVDIEQNVEIARKYKIKSVPTTVFERDSMIIDRFAGFIDDVDLESKLMNLLFDLGNEIDFN